MFYFKNCHIDHLFYIIFRQGKAKHMPSPTGPPIFTIMFLQLLKIIFALMLLPLCFSLRKLKNTKIAQVSVSTVTQAFGTEI